MAAAETVDIPNSLGLSGPVNPPVSTAVDNGTSDSGFADGLQSLLADNAEPDSRRTESAHAPAGAPSARLSSAPGISPGKSEATNCLCFSTTSRAQNTVLETTEVADQIDTRPPTRSTTVDLHRARSSSGACPGFAPRDKASKDQPANPANPAESANAPAQSVPDLAAPLHSPFLRVQNPLGVRTTVDAGSFHDAAGQQEFLVDAQSDPIVLPLAESAAATSSSASLAHRPQSAANAAPDQLPLNVLDPNAPTAHPPAPAHESSTATPRDPAPLLIRYPAHREESSPAAAKDFIRPPSRAFPVAASTDPSLQHISAAGVSPDSFREAHGPAAPMADAALQSPPPLANRDTFTALDTPLSPATTWIHAGLHHAEAGYLDPSLGWVSVRADANSAGLHATLVPGSAEAASTLGGHLAGLNAFLAEHHHAATVTLESHAADSFSSGSQFDNAMNSQSNQQQQDRNAAQSSHESRSSIPLDENVDSAIRSFLSQPATGVALSAERGLHLSVLA